MKPLPHETRPNAGDCVPSYGGAPIPRRRAGPLLGTTSRPQAHNCTRSAPSRRDADVRRGEVLLDALGSAFLAETRLLHASERGSGVRDQPEVEPIAFGPLLITAPDGRVTHCQRAMARVRTGDGRQGIGWIEWNLIQTEIAGCTQVTETAGEGAGTGR